MEALNYPITKFTIVLAVGCFINEQIELELQQMFYGICSGLILLIATNYYCKKYNKKLYWPSLLVALVAVFLGLITAEIRTDTYSKSHYIHQKNAIENPPVEIAFKVTKKLKPSRYHYRYYVQLIRIDTALTYGTLLLNLSKDSKTKPFLENQRVLTNTEIQALKPPLNPYQFNYKKYLNRRGIYKQIYLKDETVLVNLISPHSITDYAVKIRNYLSIKLDKQSLKPNEIAFLKAIFLGQRQDISFDIYEDYSKAGAIHILAISGFHIGILVMLFQLILRPILYFRYGKFIRITLILVVLWSFAIIAGLSASVLRAVTMFSLFVIAQGLKRPTKALNSLAISAFILLLIKPEFCFDVGFQLSYAAVAAIVIIKPVLDACWTLRNTVASFFLDLLKVSIAAQIGVLPLSLYYFHQFPGLFFLTNMVIIPALMLVLGLGGITLLLIGFQKPPSILIQLLGEVIQFMNRFVEWVASKEAFIFDSISFDRSALIFSYLILYLIAVCYHTKTFKSMLILGIAVLSFQISVVLIPVWVQKNSFVIFHKSRQSLIGLQTQQQLEIHHTLKTIDNERIITNYIVGARIKNKCEDQIQNLYLIKNKLLLVVDSLGIYDLKSIKPHWVFLRQSPKINLIRLIDSLSPELIIWDGSNYKSDQERWKLSCKAKKIPFHQTSEKGAFIIDF